MVVPLVNWLLRAFDFLLRSCSSLCFLAFQADERVGTKRRKLDNQREERKIYDVCLLFFGWCRIVWSFLDFICTGNAKNRLVEWTEPGQRWSWLAVCWRFWETRTGLAQQLDGVDSLHEFPHAAATARWSEITGSTRAAGHFLPVKKGEFLIPSIQSRKFWWRCDLSNRKTDFWVIFGLDLSQGRDGTI